MTLFEAENLLIKNNIPYERLEFKNEADFFNHILLFPYTKNLKEEYKVIALVIKSNNQKRNIELQFSYIGGNFLFREMFFGGCWAELYNHNEEILPDDILSRIKDVQSGNLTVIIKNNLKSKKWIYNAVFDTSLEDTYNGKGALLKTIKKIKSPRGLFSRLLNLRIQYEIYNWNNFESIIK